jgi:uncharacterized membrane protein YhfC
MSGIAGILVIVLPFFLGLVAHRRLGAGWKYFWFGVLVYLAFQLVTRAPLLLLLSNTVLAHILRTSIAFNWSWITIEAATAGLFEEVGRYVGYRLFMGREPKTGAKGVMFGIGHEGLESAVFGGVRLYTLLIVAFISAISLTRLPVAQRQLLVQQVAVINTQPVWFPLLLIWERLWSFPLQVAFSVLVLQVFRRRQGYWLLLAILFHVLVDFLSLALPQAFGASVAITLLNDAILFLFALVGLWIIWRLREPGRQTQFEAAPAQL